MKNPEHWVKASASADSGNCVEMRATGGRVQVRDTKHAAAGPVLDLAPWGFSVWLDAAKTGQFDRIA